MEKIHDFVGLKRAAAALLSLWPQYIQGPAAMIPNMPCTAAFSVTRLLSLLRGLG
jgi:hypothetical protein